MVHSARPRLAHRYWEKASSLRSSFVLGEVELCVIMRVSSAAGSARPRLRQGAGYLHSRLARFGPGRRLSAVKERNPSWEEDRNDSFILIPESSPESGDRRSGSGLDGGGAARRTGPIVLAELPEQQRDHGYKQRVSRDWDNES